MTLRKSLSLVAIAAFSTTWAGCSAPIAAPPPFGEAAVEVRIVDEAGFQTALEEAQGQVVLVDYWATWCPPCLKLLPHTIELQNRYGDRGLRVVTVSLDEPEDLADIAAVLRERKATTDNYVSRYGAGARSFDLFDIQDGTLPHLKLYDRDGRLVRTFASGTEGVDSAEIDQAVEKLLDGS